ncbi:TonB-dependent receptor [Fulvivirgaceae bacterium PWU5]|uniref:TonB-dependent receptor n=1 Tax=Dawidia cretensis TaxID=2782350 RepID=A0AAP2E1S8_9BACT|nr:TonB-dependent receptor [Dawidia cretensis]MBT1711406.1 TonB-dependent receptor [Dawidia cretensis]
MYQSLYPKRRRDTLLRIALLALVLAIAAPHAHAAALQQRTVTGHVTSQDDNQPFPGASVVVKGTTVGTVTDTNGNYSIEVNSDEAILVISAIGYATQEVVAGKHSTIDVALITDLTSLSEVVVVGYGTVKKSDVTGSLARVSSDQIMAMPVQNTLQSLQGRAAGIDVTATGRPGEFGAIRIRGNRSLLATNAPLYVVDGIPIQNGNDPIKTGGSIDMINPNDIESIEVLKDASASAIYGSRAANGVVLITTKKGKPGKTQITYSGSVYAEKINNLQEMFSAREYADYRRNAYRAVTGANNYTTPYPNPKDDKRILGQDAFAWETIAAGYTWEDKDALIPAMRPTTAEEQAKWGVDEVPVYDPNNVRTTPWTDYVEQTGVTQDHNVSISMATDKIKTYFSAGLLNQKGTNVGQDYKRYSTRLNLEVTATPWLTLGANLAATYGIQNYGVSTGGSRGAKTIYASAQGMLPFAVPYDTAGHYIFNPGANANIVNPIRDGELVINERTSLRLLGSFFAEAKLVEGLRFRVNFGPEFRNFRNGEFQDKLSSIRGGGSNSSTHFARYQQDQQVSWTLENLLFYDKAFGNHRLGLTLLQSASLWRQENSDVSANNIPYSSQLWYNIGSTVTAAPAGFGSGYLKRTMFSYMARVNYTLKDKYLVTASSRWDGASALMNGASQWDFFPSVALAWKMTEEPFMRGATWITELKPRIGFGATGTSSVEPYTTAGALLRLPYVFGATPVNAYVPSNPKGAADEQGAMPPRDLRWERSTTTNFAVDFGFFNDRITGSIDAYVTRTTDILMPQTLNSVSGYKSVTTNIGETENRGIELLINTINVDLPSFQWTTNVTFGRNRGKIVESYNGKNDDISRLWFIGKPLQVLYDYKKIGIWQEADAEEMAKFNEQGATYKAGDIRVQDVNGDYKIDPNYDRQIIGSTNPLWTGGITNTFTYKQWELSAFFYARWGATFEGGAVDMQGLYASRRIDYWRPDNPTNAYPRADFSNGGQPIHYSAMNYQDGSFVKLRYVSVAYVVPAAALERLRLSNVRLYAQMLNPYLYARTSFYDPDVASSVTSRSYVFGVNLTL